jgi:hypothetical protein
MKLKNFITLTFLCFLTISGFAQKAFENVVFRGKAQGISIKLNYADGYLGGSDIRTTDLKTNKTSKFVPDYGSPDENHRLKFKHYAAKHPEKELSDYIILDGINDEESAPKRIVGKYYFKGKVYPFVLVR